MGDRLHIHYLLLDSGMTVPQVVGAMVAAGAVCGAVGVGFPMIGIPEWLMLAAFLALWLLTYKWISRKPVERATAVANAPKLANGDVGIHTEITGDMPAGSGSPQRK
jgi:hypothetical protein